MSDSSTDRRKPADRRRRLLHALPLAARLARRQLRRSPRRSLLILVLIGTPLALIAFVMVLGATAKAPPAAQLGWQLAGAQASVEFNVDEAGLVPVAQTPKGSRIGDAPGPLTPTEGVTIDPTAQGSEPGVGPQHTEALQRLTGGTALPVGVGAASVRINEHEALYTGLATPDPARIGGMKMSLLEGRWPANNREIVVTPTGQEEGLPTSGQAVLADGMGPDARLVTVDVVGVANAYGASLAGRPSFVELLDVSSPRQQGYLWNWLIYRDTPVKYAETLDWNRRGMLVVSRDVVESRISRAAMPEQVRQVRDLRNSVNSVAALVAAITIVLILVVLLTMPAFSVGLIRRRRELALIAGSGAGPRVIWLLACMEALVLGVVGTLGGIGVGAGLAALVHRWLNSHMPWTWVPALVVPRLVLALVAVVAISCVVLSALVPVGRVVGSRDLAARTRGVSYPSRAKPKVTVAGIVLMVVCAAVIWVLQSDALAVSIAMVVLVLAALAVIPGLLVLLDKASPWLGVSVRMALRDMSRHRTRTVPAVGAVMACAVMMTAGSVVLASGDRQAQAHYVPQAPDGMGWVTPGRGAPQSEVGALTRIIRQNLTGSPVAVANLVSQGGDEQVLITVRPPSCADADLAKPGTGRCDVPSALEEVPEVAVVDPADAMAVWRLPPEQVQALQDGKAVVGRQMKVTDGQIALITTRPGPSPERTSTRIAAERSQTVAAFAPSVQVLISAQTEQRLGGSASETWCLVFGTPDGSPIPDRAEASIGEAIRPTTMGVERGYVSDGPGMMALICVLLTGVILVVTLTGTALAVTEQRSMVWTLLSVGATNRTRRWMVGVQSALTTLVGGVLGIVVGLPPGIALAHALLISVVPDVWNTDFLAISWQPFVVLLIGIPVAAALMSSLALLGSKPPGRRLT